MPHDYYIVLGVERGADLSQIKRAYRNASKRYHPDTVGGDTCSRKFIEAQEAYEVLSDTAKRRAYDAELVRREPPVNIRPSEEASPRQAAPREAFRRRPTVVDDCFEGFKPGLDRPSAVPGYHHHGLYLQAILSPEEALHGGIFPVSVPVMAPCPDCRTSSLWEAFFCPCCRGRGLVHALREFNLQIPPETKTDTTVAVTLEDIGLPDVRLIIDVLVSRKPFGYGRPAPLD